MCLPAMDPMGSQNGSPRWENHEEDYHDAKQNEGIGSKGAVFKKPVGQCARHGWWFQVCVCNLHFLDEVSWALYLCFLLLKMCLHVREWCESWLEKKLKFWNLSDISDTFSKFRKIVRYTVWQSSIFCSKSYKFLKS